MSEADEEEARIKAVRESLVQRAEAHKYTADALHRHVVELQHDMARFV